MMKVYKNEEITIEYKKKDLFVLADIEVERDNNYGADADGNRSIAATFVYVDIHSILDEKDNELKDDSTIRNFVEDVISEDYGDL